MFSTGNHSPYFAPVIQPTLTVAIDAYTVGTFAFLYSGKTDEN